MTRKRTVCFTSIFPSLPYLSPISWMLTSSIDIFLLVQWWHHGALLVLWYSLNNEEGRPWHVRGKLKECGKKEGWRASKSKKKWKRVIGRMVLSVKCLPCKHDGLSLTLRSQVKIQWQTLAILAQRSQRQDILCAHWPAICSLLRDPFLKEVNSIFETWGCPLCSFSCTCIYVHKNRNTYINTKLYVGNKYERGKGWRGERNGENQTKLYLSFTSNLCYWVFAGYVVMLTFPIFLVSVEQWFSVIGDFFLHGRMIGTVWRQFWLSLVVVEWCNGRCNIWVEQCPSNFMWVNP